MRFKIIEVKVKQKVIKLGLFQNFRSSDHTFVFLFPPMPPVGREFMVNELDFVGGL
jgi:hypothetical protein